MWTQITTIITVVTIIVGHEMSEGPPGIIRIMSDNVRSVDYKIVYGDEDMIAINEVINDVEKNSGLKKSVNLNEAIEPLSAEDVKCIMSVDRYCSKEMSDVKKVLVQAIKDDCVKCTVQEKDKAGRVIASMIAHDPVAWKLFLTRSALLIKKRQGCKTLKRLKFKDVGEPEEVIRKAENSFVMSGVKVRVKRYVSEIVN